MVSKTLVKEKKIFYSKNDYLSKRVENDKNITFTFSKKKKKTLQNKSASMFSIYIN